MSKIVPIKKLGDVCKARMQVEASKKDAFYGTLVQSGTLPFVFYYGDRRTLQHTCASCGKDVEAGFWYGSKQLTGLGSLSRQDFAENKQQLDIVGRLFEQHLYHEIDANGFESYLYLSDIENRKGALLNVAYYRCEHCRAQYLVSYQNQLKEERPPFEPDEIFIDKILWVEFAHEEFLSALNRLEVC